MRWRRCVASSLPAWTILSRTSSGFLYRVWRPSRFNTATPPSLPIAMGKLGGVAVLNLEGLQTRYKNPEEVLDKIVHAGKDEATHLLQRIYTEPVQEDLIAARIREIK